MIEVIGYDTNIVIQPSNTPNPIIPVFEDKSFPLANRTTNGFTNPEGTVQNIGIVKNASTYFNLEAEKQGWTFQSIPFTKKITRFVIIRDPYERYLSGLAEDLDRYLTLNNDKRAFFTNLLENNFFFDFFDFLFDADVFVLADHTQLQTKILEWAIMEIGVENLTFIKLTNKLNDNINLFLKGENCHANFSNIKINEKNRTDNMASLYQMVNLYFQDGKNLKKKEKLIDFLKPDYNFVNSITFFNRV